MTIALGFGRLPATVEAAGNLVSKVLLDLTST
ncbi:hypothetical protein HNQ08_004342 [Deinococcus humi]|uniref:Uncharacterized protein n=1 Tax=Deinococcus humi TaxID=662880 RepID=A0A7W8NG89_9DEIO|nr:hypothetical protein [Deinococcus humi]